MKEGGRSGEAVVKKKSSSGCLIIKKKTGGDGTGIGMGMGGFSGGSSSRKFLDLGKEKKRSRLVLSDSGSSDESLQPVRRKVVPGGSEKFRTGGLPGNRVIGRGDRKMNNGLDVFEFDEYERFDEKARKDFYDDRLKLYRHSGGDPRESGVGSSRAIVDKRRHSYVDSTSDMLSVKSKSKYGVTNSRFEMEDDEAHLPISLLREKYREASDEPIRLQGKNGVLKVMVNKKKKMGLPHRSYDHVEAEDRKDRRSEDVLKKKMVFPQKGYDHLEDEVRNVSRSVGVTKKKALMRHSTHSELKHPEKPIASMRRDKHELKLQKSLSTKSNRETDDSDTSLKLASPSMRACTSTKDVKKEGNRTPPNENVTPVKGKETKVKRGSGTEKQLLREKIRNMLLAAGWTIDYRPRRNRDYLDAVYINPSGTAYWSIIKAYEALQKQSEEEETKAKPAGDFTPLPDEILSKLTRQTRKKMEREMKKKRRDEGSGRISKKARVKESAGGTDSDQQEEKLSSYMKPNRKSLKGRMNESDNSSEDDSSDNLARATPKVGKPSSGIHGRKSRKIGRTLVVRSSDKGLNSENDGFVPYTGKRTLLSWLIDSETVHMSEKVQYMNRRKSRAMLEGWITRDGIHCGCCSKILTVSKFELHAGSKLRLPFPNIFLQSGQSLMQCQIDAWNKQKESERQGFHTVNTDGDDPNDDTCGLCGDGGDLICCDGCPSTFHQSCLNIQMLPKGDWHCPNCACKFCQIAGGSSTEASGRAESALLTCRLCEKKYHESCSKEKDIPADSGDAIVSFCGHECRELYGHLQKLLGVKHEMESGFSWSLICRSDPSSDTLPLEFSQNVECNSKLAIALSVMDECFLPIVDRRSGINLIHNVVYNCGSNFSRLNYSGFYTAILERGDEIICAASIRIHGTQLAEMPFIGTRHIYRRQGMCRRLLDAIESVLSSFKVEKLIIPAIAEHMHTWTDVFGFNPIEESHKQEIRSMNMLVFPGTDMLQKPLVRHKIPKRNGAVISDVECVEVEDKGPLGKKLETGSSNLNESNNEIAGADSSPHPPAAPSDDSSLDTSCEPVLRPSSKENLPISSPSIIKVEEPCSDVKCPSPSGLIPAINETGKPTLDSPFKDDIQLPVMGDGSKLDSSTGLDLNTCDNTVEQDGNETNEKIADVGSCLQLPLPLTDDVSLDPPCKPEPQSPLSESISIDAQSENKVVESHTASDGSPVAVETPDPAVNENIPLANKLTESATDLDSVSVGHTSPVALSAHEAAVKENSQLDNNVITESATELECVSVSNGSPLALSSHEAAVKENNQLDNKVTESATDVERVSVSNGSSLALGSHVSNGSSLALGSHEAAVKENNQLDNTVPEAATDMEHVSVSNADHLGLSSHEVAVKDNYQLDNKVTESATDLECVSVSNASPLAHSSHEATVKENNQLENKVTEYSTDTERVSVSYASSVALETRDSPVKENIQSLTEEGMGDADEVIQEQAPCLKVDDDSLEGNKAKDENGTTDLDFVSSVHENGESAVKFSSDLNQPDQDETESKSDVASNAETKCKDVNPPGPSETVCKDVNLPGQDETGSEMGMASNAETECKDVNRPGPGPNETESQSDVASEVAASAGTEHKENTCTSQILL